MLSLGVEHPAQSPIVRDKMKSSCMENLGVENASQSEVIKEKKRIKNLEHWGVDNFSKSPLFSAYHRKRIFHDNIWFDSNWEIEVYDYCKLKSIEFTYQPRICIQYEYNGKTHYYHPDFLIGEKLYEVKGDNFFKVDDNGNEIMICPYRKPEWTDEDYIYRCGREEAKHQCMLNNGVIILRRKELNNMSEYIKGT